MFAMHHVYDLFSAASIFTLDSAPYFNACSRPNVRRKGKPCLTRAHCEFSFWENSVYLPYPFSFKAPESLLKNGELKKYLYFIYYFLLFPSCNYFLICVTCPYISGSLRKKTCFRYLANGE